MVGAKLAALLLLIAIPAEAQTVRGLLTDSVSHAPLPGAFLTLVDAHGVERARTMTNPAGEFTLTAPGAGVYRLRSKRIGFRPLVSPPLTLRTNEVTAFNAAIDPIPISLQEVVVAGERQCDISGDTDQAAGAAASVAALWDEVREALAAVSWTSRVPSYWFETAMFERDLSASGRRLGPDSTWRESGFSTTPFRNFATPAELDSQGYVVVTDTGWVYRAPDPDVLLTDVFLRTHCFETKAGRGDMEGLVGLVFTSARGRTVPDITGTLWVDRRTSELRQLQFSYIRLPQSVASSQAGGHLEFLRLPSGVWIVRDWSIRMPHARARQPVLGVEQPPEVIGFRERGGSAGFIKANDGTVVYGTPPAPEPISVGRAAPPPAASVDTAATPAAAPQGAPNRSGRARTRSSTTIDQTEIDSSTAIDAYALIQESRPTWFHQRGTISISDPTAGNLQVYLDGTPYGDVSRLHEISRNDLRELHFLAAAAAEMRYGPGHAGGVIEVVTGVGAPAQKVATGATPTSRPEPPPPPPPPPPPVSGAERRQAHARDSNVLKEEEFASTTAQDAMALVQEFRPNWLHSRGVVSIRDPHAGDLQVYVNGVANGDVNRLREIPTMDIRELRFLGAADAQLRYGVGHAGGVIEVWTK